MCDLRLCTLQFDSDKVSQSQGFSGTFTIFRLAGKRGTSLFYNKYVSIWLSLIAIVSSTIVRDPFLSGRKDSDNTFDNVPYVSNL